MVLRRDFVMAFHPARSTSSKTKTSRKGLYMHRCDRLALLGVCLFLFCSLGAAGDKKKLSIPAAPLPKQIILAETVFIAKGPGSDRYIKGGADLAFDTFYAEMKNWGRYRIVDSPTDADLILELVYSSQRIGTHVWSTTNTYTGTTDVQSTPEMDPHLSLSIYDRKTGFAIWSTAEARERARLNRNREKNLLNAVREMVLNLRTRVESTPSGTDSSGPKTVK